MKRRNFPGRVLQRRIDAVIRSKGKPYRIYSDSEFNSIVDARQQYSKRNRS